MMFDPLLWDLLRPPRPQASKFDASRFNMHEFQHMESTLQTVMGHTVDVATDRVVTLRLCHPNEGSDGWVWVHFYPIYFVSDRKKK